MSSLKKSTVKSSTFWINAITAVGGIFVAATASDTGQQAVDAATAAANTAPNISPELVTSVLQVVGVTADASTAGAVTAILALINIGLRYKTQRKLEKQLDGQ